MGPGADSWQAARASWGGLLVSYSMSSSPLWSSVSLFYKHCPVDLPSMCTNEPPFTGSISSCWKSAFFSHRHVSPLSPRLRGPSWRQVSRRSVGDERPGVCVLG